MKLAVDAMGGDFAPDHVVIGAAQAIGPLAAGDYQLLPGDKHVKSDSCQRGNFSATSFAIHHSPDSVRLVELPPNTLAQNHHSSTREAFHMLKREESDSLCGAGDANAMHPGALFPIKKMGDEMLTAPACLATKKNRKTVGVSPILVINRTVMTGHGAISPEAIKNMILLAYRMAATNFYQKIKVAFGD